MFGKIISIENNYVILQNNIANMQTNYLNYHVVFPEEGRSIVGEIVAIDEKTIKIFLVGEIINGIFNSGVLKKPSFNSKVRLVYKNEIEMFLGPQNINSNQYLYFGKSNTYDNFNISAKLNDFFANHFAIIGNTGSGKSCGVARILQNIFLNPNMVPKNAHLVLFNVYGEYNTALSVINDKTSLGYKNITTKLELSNSDILNIPAYFLEVDDLALLLNTTSSEQLPIIEKALKLVLIFKSNDSRVIEYKNDIIASSLLDILSSGKTSTQIRDQIIAVLTHYHTETLNLDTQITQPGYNRTIRQCLNIDNQGKINAVQLVVDFLDKFQKLDLSTLELENNIIYNLDDIYYAFEFALISEGILKSEKVYDDYNRLKVRLQQIINSDAKRFFEVTNEKITKETYIKKLFSSPNKNVQIVNMNLNYIDERFAKVITKIYTKMFFDFSTELSERASYPIHIVLEEAHRYVQNDNDINVLGYNIFDRITKEGRKYGILLGLITQRPSELSNTALSQCSNFITFRMFHPEDLRIISTITSNVSTENIEKLKNLTPGSSMVFGTAFKIPLITKIDLPNPMPQSTSVDIVSKWF